MDKTEIIAPEILDNTKNVWVKIETIYPDTIPLPTYDYWNSQNTLDAEVSLRNLSTGWQFYIWSTTITATWDIVVTWVWFTPKLVKFTVCSGTWNTWEVWIGSMTSTSQQCVNVWNSVYIGTQCIYYWSSWSVKARAVYVSMDSDWFTINCTYYANTTYVTYECYG